MDFSQDFNPHWTKNQIKFDHDESIPSHFRCIVVGTSGSGKTFRVFNMLLRPNYLDYDTLHIYSPTIYQDEYKMLLSGLKNKLHKEDIIACFLNQNKLHNDPEIVASEYAKTLDDRDKWLDVKVFSYGITENNINNNNNNTGQSNNNNNNINKRQLPQPDDLEKGRKHLIVFDDCMTGPQKQIENYFTRGRHNNCNVIYIAQNWFELPNKTVRGNCNLIMLFPSIPQDRLKRLYNEVLATGAFTFVSPDTNVEKYITQTDFVNLCYDKWSKPFHYVTINKETRTVS